MMSPRLSVLILVLFSIALKSNADSVTIDLPLGTLKGLIVDNKYEKAELPRYYSFKGVRYAKQLTEENKFLAPEDAEPWNGIYDAIEHGNQCVNYNPFINSVDGETDCLFLNLYTTNLPSEQEECNPVIVFIHGGAFIFGSGDDDMYGPDYFMATTGQILITINYRLTISGFLNGRSKLAPGNAGLKDQVAALRWVQKYIKYFGGCPDKITIQGESAGSASVGNHLISPMSEGLFQRAILQSGSATDFWAFSSNPEKAMYYLANTLGIKSEDKEEILRELTAIPNVEILEKFIKSFDDEQLVLLNLLIFLPSAEIELDGVEPFLLESPTDALIRNHTKRVDIMMGTLSDEGAFFAKEVLKYMNNENAAGNRLEVIKKILSEEQMKILGENNMDQFSRTVTKQYTGGESSEDFTFETMSRLISDVGFFVQFDMQAKVLKHYGHKIYAYHFAHKSSTFGLKNLMDDVGEVCMHSDDLFLMFFSNLLENIPDSGSVEEKLIKRFTRLWINFSRTGNPTPNEEFDDVIPVKWPEMGDDNNICVIDGQGMRVTNSFYPERICFWKNIIKPTFKELASLFNDC